ncbi:MAG: hypothetical protein AAF492_13445 [Verrucomicrobiota bacterium]
MKNDSQRFARHPIDPDRVRRMPRQFAPLDRQLVYGNHVCYMSPEQIVLYTFLECVSDRAGLSFYADDRICDLLGLSLNGLWQARDRLVDAGCLLYRKPLYQLLNLPELRA